MLFGFDKYAAAPPELLDYNDYPSVRENLRSRALESVQAAFPVKNDKFTLELSDVKYDGKPEYSLKEQRRAIVEGRSLANPVSGVWTLRDNATGAAVSSTGRKRVLNVPYLTNRGTYIRNGTEYTVAKQFRLIPNAYTRRTDSGIYETQFNVKPRTGSGFRIFMEPESGNFYMRHKGRKIHLYPVLKAMGVDDETIKQQWGEQLYEVNKKSERSPYAVNWLKQFQPANFKPLPGMQKQAIPNL
jgi:DNA-directed RNA polymerase beta subunit